MFTRQELSGLYTCMPDPQTVQYSVRNTETTGWAEPVDITHFERRWPSTREIQYSNGRIENGDIVWFGWAEKLGGIRPKEGDRITHEGKLWLVKMAREEIIGQRWRITCAEARHGN